MTNMWLTSEFAVAHQSDCNGRHTELATERVPWDRRFLFRIKFLGYRHYIIAYLLCLIIVAFFFNAFFSAPRSRSEEKSRDSRSVIDLAHLFLSFPFFVSTSSFLNTPLKQCLRRVFIPLSIAGPTTPGTWFYPEHLIRTPSSILPAESQRLLLPVVIL